MPVPGRYGDPCAIVGAGLGGLALAHLADPVSAAPQTMGRVQATVGPAGESASRKTEVFTRGTSQVGRVTFLACLQHPVSAPDACRGVEAAVLGAAEFPAVEAEVLARQPAQVRAVAFFVSGGVTVAADRSGAARRVQAGAVLPTGQVSLAEAEALTGLSLQVFAVARLRPHGHSVAADRLAPGGLARAEPPLFQ